MNIIISILLAALFSFWFNEILMLPKRIKLLNRKPFNCIQCLSAWSGVAFYFIPDIIRTPLFVLLASGLVAIIIEIKMKKL